ncbi:MAG: hypothetical protein K0M63_02960 [Weeksellaceae bacterium]|nr:hypothetical protein [Weeksellaceae bacterium]
METSLLIQYIIIAIMVLAASYSIFRIFRKNFSARKFDSKGKNCDSDCGCG